MSIRKIAGALLYLPSMFGMSLMMISAGIFHFFTAIVAYGLAGPGWWGFVATGAAFSFPIVAEIVVFISVWNVTGEMVNNYSIWLFMWLAFLIVLAALMAVSVWLFGKENS